jgi:hypothetical protein
MALQPEGRAIPIKGGAGAESEEGDEEGREVDGDEEDDGRKLIKS